MILPARITTEAGYLECAVPVAAFHWTELGDGSCGELLPRTAMRAPWTGCWTSMRRQPSPPLHLNAACVDGGQHVADHVLVDEGQDLTPSRWQLLRALAGPQKRPDDLFIAEDSHQRIYGQKVVLSRYGIEIVGLASRDGSR